MIHINSAHHRSGYAGEHANSHGEGKSGYLVWDPSCGSRYRNAFLVKPAGAPTRATIKPTAAEQRRWSKMRWHYSSVRGTVLGHDYQRAGEDMIQTLKILWDRRGGAWNSFAACALAGGTIFLGSLGPGVAATQTDEERPGYVPTEAEEQLPNELRRQMGFFRTTEPPGTIIVHTAERFLYLVQPNNRALRFGIGVGREGFQWTGLKRIDRKAEWPDWTPPPEMIARQPYLPRFMAGGPGNPMGARALYIGGTVYRIHGTNAPHTIGTAVSSGCFRLTNPELIDLYERVPLGTRVVVRQAPEL